METQTKASAKNIFLNLGAFISLYTLVATLVNLLFGVIDAAYPPIVSGYNYFGSSSISWPVATLVVFFPIFIVLMWFLEKYYKVEPERQYSGIHKWLTYITLFISGLAIAGDLITVLYYFIDGQELTTGFLLKILVLLVIASGMFSYYILDVSGKLTSALRKVYRVIALIVVVGSILWGFSVLGSPRTQRLYKYDEQKLNDLSQINNEVTNFYSLKGVLPDTLDQVANGGYYIQKLDSQNGKPYEYKKTDMLAYSLCAEFNKDSKDKAGAQNAYPGYQYYAYGRTNLSWEHPAGRFCFAQTVNPNIYSKPVVY